MKNLFKIIEISNPKSYQVSSKFDLATHFRSTLNKTHQTWRKTQHHLAMVKYRSAHVGFAGYEIGPGDVIQRYIGEDTRTFLKDKTCFIHAMEVMPLFRGQGIQTLLWLYLCEYVLKTDIYSIVFEPRDPQAYLRYFTKFTISPEQHALSQVVCLGSNIGSDDPRHMRYGENIISIFHFNIQQIQTLQQAIKHTLDSDTVCEYRLTR